MVSVLSMLFPSDIGVVYDEITVGKQLSPYRMNLYNDCPKHFQYRQLNLPCFIADDSAMEFGSMMHRTTERFYHQIGVKPTKDEIFQIASLSLEHHWLPRFQTKKRTAKKALANFIQFEYWRLEQSKQLNIPYKVLDEENNMIDPFIEVGISSDKYYARVDFFWKAKGMLLDFKFGKSTTIWQSYKIQLSIEKHVIEYNDHKVKSSGFGFFNQSPRPSRVATFGQNKLKEIRDQLIKSIIANNFPRKKGNLCWTCSDYIRCTMEENGCNFWSGILG